MPGSGADYAGLTDQWWISGEDVGNDADVDQSYNTGLCFFCIRLKPAGCHPTASCCFDALGNLRRKYIAYVNSQHSSRLIRTIHLSVISKRISNKPRLLIIEMRPAMSRTNKLGLRTDPVMQFTRSVIDLVRPRHTYCAERQLRPKSLMNSTRPTDANYQLQTA